MDSDPKTPILMSRLPSTRLYRSRPVVVAIVVFALAILVSAGLIWKLEQQRVERLRADVFGPTRDHARSVQEHLDRALSATYALAALVQQGHGVVENFDEVATKMLPFYPGVSVLILAPDGVISNAIPLAGNEKAIGLDLFKDPVMRKEALIARDSGKLTLAGPFELAQGGLGAVARLPIYFDDAQARPEFWGFANVVMRFPQALESAQLPELVARGLEYKLWRVHPESGEKQIIHASGPAELVHPVATSFVVPNGVWTLSVAPRQGWGDPIGLSIQWAAALLFSSMLAYLSNLLIRQRAYKEGLEALVVQRTSEIRASQIQLAATLEAIPDLLFEMDLNGRYLSYHSPRSELLAAPAQTFIGKTLSEILPQDAAAVIFQALQLAHQTGQTSGQQYTLPLPQGIRWFELSVARKLVAAGEEPRLIVMSRDITQRKAAEAKVLRLTQLYAASSECSLAIVRSKTPQDLFTAICRNAVQYGGM